MSGQLVIAVDGGNSKTDLALLSGEGDVLSLVRGAGSSPHQIGLPASIELIGELVQRAHAQAGLEGQRADVAVLLLAGADLDAEEEELRVAACEREWAELLEVGNDTLAVLRAGSESGFGVAVVCGAGINACARAPDGREVRFPSLGAITGDWGGGADLGLAALGKAVRAEDGRGRATLLAQLVPDHFSMGSAEEVALAIHAHELDFARLVELAPLVLAAADGGDLPAMELRERLAAEIVSLVRAAADRGLVGVDPYDVVLGGSLLSGSAGLSELVIERLHEALPAAEPRVSALPPIVGSALLGLDLLGADPDAHGRLQDSFRERLEPEIAKGAGR
jgi:N-acetylglucosamine kinase-like BadF-type ATPase